MMQNEKETFRPTKKKEGSAQIKKKECTLLRNQKWRDETASSKSTVDAVVTNLNHFQHFIGHFQV